MHFILLLVVHGRVNFILRINLCWRLRYRPGHGDDVAEEQELAE